MAGYPSSDIRIPNGLGERPWRESEDLAHYGPEPDDPFISGPRATLFSVPCSWCGKKFESEQPDEEEGPAQLCPACEARFSRRRPAAPTIDELVDSGRLSRAGAERFVSSLAGGRP